MNAPFSIAQVTGSAVASDFSAQSKSPRVIKLEKPQGNQAVTIHLDGNTKIDLSDIASDKITFVRVGERLVILFDNQATVTIDPVFGSDGQLNNDITFQVGSDRVLNGAEFAAAFPIGTDQSILPAAGEGAGGPASGAHFADAAVDPLGPITLNALLGPEALDGAAPGPQNTISNANVIIGIADVAVVDEDGLAGGNAGGPGDVAGEPVTFTGSLHVNFGQDVVGRSFTFSASQPGLGGLTSGGQDVHIALGTIGGEPALIGYIGSDASLASARVFVITLDNGPVDGAYSVTLLKPLDHPIHGTEDTLDLSISYIATNGHGDSATGTLTIEINDDSPTVAPIGDQTVIETLIPAVGDPTGHFVPQTTGAISLNVNWGADDNNSGTANRSLAFKGISEGDAVLDSNGHAVTADGAALHYHFATIGDQTVLVAYRGSDPNVEANQVFTVTLDDTSAHGNYTFNLLDNLDHPTGAGKNDLPFSFTVTATDADGDPVDTSFTVHVTDDVPTVNTSERIQPFVAEQTQSGESNAFIPHATDPVALNIDWGADDANPNVGPIDRKLSLTDLPAGLTSGGIAITYTFDASTSLLTASAGDKPIFTIQLFDTGNGSYVFTLLAPLDHPANPQPSEGEEQTGQNDLPLNFGVIATDADGDSIDAGTITIHITDDVPVPGEIAGKEITEQAVDNVFQEVDTGQVSLNIDWNSDDNNVPNALGHERSVAFSSDLRANLLALGLTSDGADLDYTVSQDGTVLTATADGRTIFTVTLTDDDHGTYQFVLKDNLDHLGEGQGDAISLRFDVVATDADGDHAPTSFTVNIDDLGPSFNAQAVENGNVDEDGLSNGNPGVPPDASYAGSDYPGEPVTANGALGVTWGADDNNSGTIANRALAFSGIIEGSAVVDRDGNALSSDGLALHYHLTTIDGEPALVAYKGEDYTNTANQVFTVTLDDTTSTGTYHFTLTGNLDHSPESGANIEDDIVIKFAFVATDADNDPVDGSFTVTVNDDAPVAAIALNESASITLDESVGVNANDPNAAVDDDVSANPFSANYGTPFGLITTASVVTDTSLYGADDGSAKHTEYALTSATGGTFDGAATGMTVTGGHAIYLFTDANGDIIGREGTAAGADPNGDVAFALHIDATTGDVTIAQYLAIKHGTAGSTEAAYDDTTNGVLSDLIHVTATVTDSDNDTSVATSSGALTVTFQDDGPSLTATVTEVTSDEGDILTLLSQGSSPNDGNSDGSYTGGPFAIFGPAEVSGSLAATVDFGTDGAASGGGFSFIAAANAVSAMQALGLTSKGSALSYVIIGNELVAYVNVFGNGYQPLLDRTVFTLDLQSNGSFEFKQYDQLDHRANAEVAQNFELRSGSGSIDAIDFGSIIKATDGDGDSVVLTGQLLVQVRDDVPVVVLNETGFSTTIDETGGSHKDDTTSSSVRSQFVGHVTNTGTDSHNPDFPAPIYARGDFAVVTASSPLGADDLRTTTLSLRLNGALGLNESNHGLDSGLMTTREKTEIYLFKEGDLIVGRYDSDGNGSLDKAAFAIAIDQSGRISIAQYVAIVNPDASNNPDNIVDLDGTVLAPGDKILAVATVSDYDGDTVESTAGIGEHIRFADDGPTASNSNHTVQLDDDDVTGNGIHGNPGRGTDHHDGAGSDGVAPKFATGTLIHDYGADGPGLTVLTNTGAPAGFTYDLVNPITLNIYQEQNGTNVLVLTVNLTDPVSGHYSVTQVAPIAHGESSLVENNIDLTINYKVIDGDADSAIGTLHINVDDDSPTVGAVTAPVYFNQTFDTATDAASAGFFDGIVNGTNYGHVTIEASGTNGIVTKSGGGNYALLTQDGPAGNESGPFTQFDGYKTSFNGGFTSSIDIYLDPNGIHAGEGFDYSVAINDQSGTHLRDFIFHIGEDSTGHLYIGAGNGSGFAPLSDSQWAADGNKAAVTGAGWYTFEHVFHDAGDGSLAVDLNVYDSAHHLVFSETLNDPADLISTIVGGNRYAWFPNIDVAGGIAVDNAQLDGITSNIGFVNENDLPNGNDSNKEPVSVSGDLAISWGADSANPDVDGHTHAYDRQVTFNAGLANNSTVTVVCDEPLTLTSNGHQVLIVRVSDTEIYGIADDTDSGQVSLDGRQVFHVTISDQNTGSYKFTLLGPIDHPDSGADDLTFTFGVNAIDADGDSVPTTFSVDVRDDVPLAPDIAIVPAGGDGAVLIADETAGVQSAGPDSDAPGDTLHESDVANLPPVFAGAAVLSDAGTGLNFAQHSGAVTTTPHYGADSAGTTVLALTQADGSAFTGQGTNFFDTATGHRIYLYTDEATGIVVGRVGDDATANSANPEGAISFAFAIENDGTLSMVEYRALQHPDNASRDESITLHAANGDDLLYVAATSTDGDGDVSPTSTSALTISVQDDAPLATATILTGAVYESELNRATDDVRSGTQVGNSDDKNGDSGTDDSILTGNLSSLVSMGADGGTFVVEATNLSSSLTSLTSHGVALTYTVDSATNTLIAWAGSTKIFTFAVNATTGDYTVTLTGPLDHIGGVQIDGFNVPLAAIGTVGSTYAVPEISGNSLAFEGRLPDGDAIIKVTNSGNSAVNWTLDNTDGGTDYPLTIPAHTSIFINVGPIGTPANVHFDLTGPGAPANGHTVVNSGHGTFNVSGGDAALALDLSSAVTARDDDGDTVALHDQLTITVKDDAPVTTGTPAAANVTEVGLPLVSNDSQSLKIAYGADGIGGLLTFAVDSHGDPIHPAGLTSDGVALAYTLQTLPWGEQQLVAYKSTETVDQPVFIVALNSPGNPTYVFTLFQNLDHGAGSDNLALSFTVNGTDYDGDSVQQSFTVNVADSVPHISDSAIGNVSEDGPLSITGAALAVDWGSDNANVAGANRSLTFSDDVVTATDPAGNTVALKSSGADVHIGFIGGVLVGYVNDVTGSGVPSSVDGSRVVFVASLSDVNGTYDFTLKHPLDHAAPVGTSDYLDLAFNITATDSDGDPATGTFTVRVDAAGTIGSIDYTHETTGVFVNLDSHDHTINGQFVAAERSTDITGQGPVVGIDNVHDITVARGGSGDDILVGSGVSNTLDGGIGADTIVVVPDSIVASGTRTLDHGDGTSEQVSVAGRAVETDQVIGGVGYDTLQFDLDDSAASGFLFDGSSASNTVSGIERFIGTDGNDVIILPTNYTTDGSGVTVNGGKGDDIIAGSNNADALFGGEGNDKISGLDGNDSINGNSGDDTIWGGAGNDTIHGDFGDDTITGGLGDDTLYGDNGNDNFIYKVGDGHDTIDGGAGTSDRLNVNGNNQNQTFALTALGGTGFTVETDGDSTPEISAINVEKVALAVAGGSDKITINDIGSDTVTITGATGDFTVDGANLPEIRVLNTGSLDFRFNGGSGNDTIDASALNSAASPQTLSVTLDGGAGDDIIKGSTGADTIIGGTGDDHLYGGTGNDTFLYTVGDGADIIDGGDQTGTTNPNYDVFSFAGDDQARDVFIHKATSGTDIVPTSGANATDLVVAYDSEASLDQTTVRMDGIEGIDINAGTGPLQVFLGDVSGTALAPSTIAIHGGSSNDSVTISSQFLNSAGDVHITFDGGAGDDTVIFGELDWKDATITLNGNTYTITANGHTFDITNVEAFQFHNGVATVDTILEKPPLLDDWTLSVAENSAGGTVVGTVTGSDANGSLDQLTYSFAGGSGAGNTISADGKFVINGATGEITVANGAVLDYETTPSISETVLLTDSKGQSDNTTVTINLTDVQGASTIGGTTTGSVTEDVTLGRLQASENFESYGLYDDAPAGWSNGFIDTTKPPSSTQYLTENDFHSFDGQQSVAHTFAIQNPGQPTAIDFDFYKIDRWQGASLLIFLNGEQAFTFEPEGLVAGGLDGATGAFTLQNGLHGTYTITSSGTDTEFANGAGTDSGDRVYHVHLDLDSAGATLTLGFGDTIASSIYSDTFGIDNIKIVTDGGKLFTRGDLTISNPDISEAHFVAQASTAGNHGFGTFTLTADGHWTYSADNSNPAIQALGSTGTLTDSFTAVSQDGTASQVVTVTIHGTNDAPTITAGDTVAYTEGDPAILVGASVAVADIDSPTLHGATVKISGNFAGAEDHLNFVDQNGITGVYNAANGTLTLTGDASLASYQAALQSITYSNSSTNPSGATRTISFQVDDGDASNHLSNVATATVTVTPVNNAPVNGVPGPAQSTNEDTALVFSTANGNAITVSDTDSGTLTVMLTAANGAMTLSGINGLSFSNGDGTADGTMTFSGTVSAINAALNGLAFAPTGNYSGSASIQVQTSDGTTSDSDAISININAVADAPTIAVADTAIAPVPGTIFQVNTVSTGSDIAPAVAALTGGGFVETWQSFNLGSDPGYGIYGQRFDSHGNKVGGEFHINTTTADTQQDVQVAGLQNGGFVAVWNSYGQDGSALGVYARIYDAAGNPLSPQEFRVNTATDANQMAPAIAVLGDGSFVIVWSSAQATSVDIYDVYSQHYAADGTPIGGETKVNAVTADWQTEPSITALTNGGYVVTWTDGSVGATATTERAQIFTANGTPVGGELTINSATAGTQAHSEVWALAGGGFVVTWQSFGSDGSFGGIAAQMFDASGNKVGNAFQVNTQTTGYQEWPDVLGLADGGFIIAWDGGANGAPQGIFAQRYDSHGIAVGGEIQLSTGGSLPQLAQLASGAVVATWSGNYAKIIDVTAPTGSEDQPFNLPITISLTDTNGTPNEVLSQVRIHGLPAGFTLAVGEREGGNPSGDWIIDRSSPAESTLLDQLAAHTGQLTVTPAADFSGTLNLEVTATSQEPSNGSTANSLTTLVPVLITPVNDAPVLAADSATANDTTAIDAGTVVASGNVLSNDHDVDGDALSVKTIRSANGDPQHDEAPITVAATGDTISHGLYGDLVIHADGSYTYTANAAFDALAAGVQKTDVFKYVATDGQGGDVAQYLTINITGANDAPVNATPAAVSVNEDTALTFTAASTISVHDADGDLATTQLSVQHGALHVDLAGGATIGAGANDSATLTLSGTEAQINAALQTLSYQGSANYNGPDAIKVVSTDTNGLSDTDTVNIQVNPVNDAPSANPVSASGNEDTTITVTLSGSDIDGTVASYKIATVAANGALYSDIGLTHQIATGDTVTSATVYFKPTADWNGATSFTYNAIDDSGAPSAATATASITVSPVNDKPVYDLDADNSSGKTGVDYQTSYTGGGAAKAIADADSHLADVDNTNMSGATITLTDALIGDTLNFDGAALNALGITTHTIDTSVAGKITLSLGGTASLANYEAAIESITFTSTSSVAGDRHITTTVSDGNLSSDVATTTVHVSVATNHAPVAVDDMLTFTPTAPTGAGWVQFTGAGGNNHWYKAVDVGLTWDQAKVAAESQGGYLATVTSAAEQTFVTGHVMSFNSAYWLGASDAASEGHWKWVTGPEAGTEFWTTTSIAGDGGVIGVASGYAPWPTGAFVAAGEVYEPNNGEYGTQNEDYLLVSDSGWWNDGDGLLGAQGYVIEWGGLPGTAKEDTPFSIDASVLLANDTDQDGNALTVTSVQSALHGTVSLVGTTITFTPAANYNGPASFIYTISDGHGGTASATASFTIGAVGDAPTGTSATINVAEDVTYVLQAGDFGFSDVDGNSFGGVLISSLPASSAGKLLYGNVAVTANQFISSVDIAAGMLTFAPKDDAQGVTGAFNFKVEDSGGLSDATTRTLTMSITNVPTDNTFSGSSSTTFTASVSTASYKDSGGSNDLMQITTSSSSTAFTNLNLLHSDNNLEIGWTTSAGTGYATILDQYVSGNTVERLQFTNGGNYLGYSLSSTAYNLQTGFSGGSNNDILIGSPAHDDAFDSRTLSGGNGNDLIFGSGGNDSLDGGAGNDLIVGGLGNDDLSGGSNDDVYVFGLTDGYDTITESSGTNDRIVIKTGGAAMSGLFAYDDNPGFLQGDLIIQYNGQQIVVQSHFSSNGSEVEGINFNGGSVYGYALGSSDYAIPTGITADPFEDGQGFRTITVSGSGQNFIAGELETPNKITGGSGNDIIFGGNQADNLSGGGGDDLIIGGKGNDTLAGGSGNDTYVFGLADGHDTITESSNNGSADRITIAAGGAALTSLAAYDSDINPNSGDLVIQFNGQQVTVSGHYQGSNAQTGVELINFDNGSFDGYQFGAGDFAISRDDPNNDSRAVSLPSGNNFAAGELNAANTITGGSGRDILIGGSQADTLSGGASDDLLIGGAGNDTLIGGSGPDTLVGGSGADKFQYKAPTDGGATVAGADHIVDFSTGEGDIFDILASGFTGVTVGQESTQVRIGSGGFTSTDQRFNFDTDTHTLSYASNGSGGGVTAVLAVLDNAANITNAQIHFS